METLYDHFKCYGWHNAMVSLREVLEDFASDEFAQRLAVPPVGGIDSDELLLMFQDFYDMVGPEETSRYRELPKDLDEQLRFFKAAATAAIDTGPRDPVPESFTGQRFLQLYDKLRRDYRSSRGLRNWSQMQSLWRGPPGKSCSEMQED